MSVCEHTSSGVPQRAIPRDLTSDTLMCDQLKARVKNVCMKKGYGESDDDLSF